MFLEMNEVWSIYHEEGWRATSVQSVSNKANWLHNAEAAFARQRAQHVVLLVRHPT